MTREQRLAKNEVLFRDVNERVREISSGTWDVAERLEFLCECVRTDCLERISLSLRDYEDLRSDPTHFVVVAGHERPELEFVVAAGDGYVVVEKNEETKPLVIEEDPRS
jgi:hypothetical protein